MTKHITVELTDEQEAHLRAAASREERSVEAVVADIVQRQMDYDAWFVDEVRRGVEEADRGELVDHGEVVAEAEARRAALLARKHAE
ncbi:MAG TPA: hypothetical protein VJU34_09960 [Phenylobacterium sp.]|nr:hypothetical protein [Phenylobacterium sp.]